MSAWRRRSRDGTADEGHAQRAGRGTEDGTLDAGQRSVFHDPAQDFDLTLFADDAPLQEESLFDADLFARAATAIKADDEEARATDGDEVPVTRSGSVADDPQAEPRAARADRGVSQGLLARFFGRRLERVGSPDEPVAAIGVAEPAPTDLSTTDGLGPEATPPVVGQGVAEDVAPHIAVDSALTVAPAGESQGDAPGAKGGPVDESADAEDEEREPEAVGRRVTRVRRRRAGRAHRTRPESEETPASRPIARASAPVWFEKAREATFRGLRTAVSVALVVAVLLGALYGLTIGVNAAARWNARRIAAQTGTLTDSTDSLLVIGVRDGVAVGFTALKAERANKRVVGIAIPDGAFVEVPGQGFERIGASYLGGPDVSKDAVSNFLGVPFRRYIVVDADTYQALLKDQNVAGLMAKATATDLPSGLHASLTTYLASVDPKDVWIAPLPVKAVAVGDQRYFEPQRAEVADLLLQWWGVKASQQKSTPRVIVYNGVGTPGLAGLASQQLIRTGFRVVNSGNAENFDYKTTLIFLYHGTQADAEKVRGILGVGEIKVQSAPQELTDLIVIIGADYRPPVADASTVPTEGAK